MHPPPYSTSEESKNRKKSCFVLLKDSNALILEICIELVETWLYQFVCVSLEDHTQVLTNGHNSWVKWGLSGEVLRVNDINDF